MLTAPYGAVDQSCDSLFFPYQTPRWTCWRLGYDVVLFCSGSSQKGERRDAWALVLVCCHCGDFAGGLVAIVGARRKKA